MTRFEQDIEAAENGFELTVLMERKAEIDRLNKEGRACKNKYRQMCIAQDLHRLIAEYEYIDKRFA